MKPHFIKSFWKAVAPSGLFLWCAATIVVGATIPNDPYFIYQWPLYNDGSFSTQCYSLVKAGADIKATQAWDIEQGDSNIVVAIIDGGCKMTHPEFSSRFWVNKKEIAGNGIDDDHNGFIDDVNGWNFLDNNNNLDDKFGHGTQMAAIVGANANNGIGFCGVDWHCKLMILIDGDTLSHSSATTKAIKYAIANGANVINLSLGYDNESIELKQVVLQAIAANIVVVAGAGNDQIDSLLFPARMPEVLSVGSSNPDDTWSRTFPEGSGGSNYGSGLKVVAPGNCIRNMDPIFANEYSAISSGTSSSTAYVSGLAALLLAQDSHRTPAQIIRIITRSADDRVGRPEEDTPGWDKFHGWGRINMYRALRADTVGISIKQVVAKNTSTAIARPVVIFEHGALFIKETRVLGIGGKSVVRTMDILGRIYPHVAK